MKVILRKKEIILNGPDPSNKIPVLVEDGISKVSIESNQGNFDIIEDETGDLLLKWDGKFTEADVKLNHIYFGRKS
jgi:hypothetical protein